jgi:hypothetical protein
MRVGFTGTREGMTRAQTVALNEWWEGLDVDEFHHGACVGADEEAVSCCQNFTTAKIIAHPGDIHRLTSRKAVRESLMTAHPKPCLNRNLDIVDACDILAACPKGPEELRSGTWATVRYARKAGRPIVIFWPDGSVTTEG